MSSEGARALDPPAPEALAAPRPVGRAAIVQWDRAMMTRLRRRLTVSILLSVSVVLSALFYYNAWALQRDFETQRLRHQKEHTQTLRRALARVNLSMEIDLRAVAERLARGDVDPSHRYVLTDDRGAILHDSAGTLAGQDVTALTESNDYSWVSEMYQHPVRKMRFRIYVFWDREHLMTLLVRNAHVHLGVSLAVCGIVLLWVTNRLTVAASDRYEELIREVEDLEEHRLRSEKLDALSKVGAGVAHEIRNPLNSIGMGIQRLQMEYSPAEREAEFAEITQLLSEEVARVNRIVEEFLQFARPPRPTPSTFDLDELARETVAVYKEDALARGVALDLDSPGTPVWVDADRDQIKQAVVNLMLNGIQAAEETGSQARPGSDPARVVVDLDASDPTRVVLGITDNGPGIPQENLERIFDVYFTTKATGSGLGLAIVQRILDSHEAAAQVASRPGRTSFSFALARVSPPRLEAAA